ncbi:hypothetical protein [Yinghuangia seranimata]|uniref:hypothetical protein n=1 Tax=Yinghuangia seranimata TaxID=408067 RepID=UPI00248CD6A5|nr:hypothetical protein [Yinghuangia seranimata]MDI2128961.1 hypothetical protein [Yinghuangia seranimata]
MTSLGRRLAAGLGAGAIVASGLLAVAPAASAGTVTPTVDCFVEALNKHFVGPQSIDVTMSPKPADPGGSVTASVTLGASPATSPVALSGVQVTPTIEFTLGGGASGTVSVTGATTTMDVAQNAPITPPPYTGSVTIPATASGDVTFTPTKLVTKVFIPAYNLTQITPCDITSGGGAVETVPVKTPQPEVPTLSADPGTVEPGTATTLAGLNWTPNAPATAALCDAAGANCNAAGISANTLAVGADGKLGGTATVAAGTADGSYTVQVSQGAKTATAPIAVKKKEIPVPQRKITLSKTDIRPWTFVKVTGENFTPNTLIAIIGVNGTTPVANFSAAWAGSDGKFTTWILVTSTKVNTITAAEIDWTFKFDKVALAPIAVHW